MAALRGSIALALLVTLAGCDAVDSQPEAEWFGILLAVGPEEPVRVEVDGDVVFDGVTWNEETIQMLGVAQSLRAEPRLGRRTVEVIFPTGARYGTEVMAERETTVLATGGDGGMTFEVVYDVLLPH